ncbi:flagellar type III secretion system pore protein FliP [Desemzia incerta]|uniref:flagellar type III secretion system pore protein FliP n=1 Tax=Desemzia incerta TaxID=82801 RepID=UPI0024C33B49|nr:flagellar type III secretion system pore protein FliP [Desemzia incerta]WHZ33118.1 flagellar type III secretion system pore protein FliP [Desemzia incerta]
MGGIIGLFGFPQQVGAIEIMDTITSALDSGAGENAETVQLFLLLTLLSFGTAFLVLTTAFTRIIVVLSFTRSSLGTQQNPPNIVIMGLAIFLTFFVMRPVTDEIMEDAINPYLNEEITAEVAIERAEGPLKEFMAAQTREKDIQLFLDISGEEKPENLENLSMTVLTPAFAISELRTAFSIGFLIFIPFLVIDMVVASILMSMGMFMLSPVMISLPFKLLLFVLVDGWYLVVESLVSGFQ